MDTPKKILVPVDLSQTSLAGLAAARALAGRWGAKLDLVFVDELRVKQDFAARLRAAAEGAPLAAARVLDGRAAEVLAREAAGADLVVMGTHGRKGVRRAVLGSTAEALMRGSPVPVLAVRSAPAEDWPSKVLVPYRFAPYADDALDHALLLAHGLGCPAVVLHVVEDAYGKMDAALGLKERVREACGRCDADEPEIALEYGRPAPRILRAAAALRCDLIVVSGHRRGRLASSTAQRLLRGSPVPILCVPAEAVLRSARGAAVAARPARRARPAP